MKIDDVKSHIETVRQQLIDHQAFTWVDDLEKARIFMESHVWAVWDFMVLLKALQRKLTCVDTYWIPQGDGDVRRLINEIVLGEESDLIYDGKATSHFELYLRAMKEAEANTAPIEVFIANLRSGMSAMEALEISEAPEGAKKFVRATLAVVERNDPSEMAAVFTFGREDLIPDMFIEIVRNLKQKFPDKLDIFTYYLERHIEVDGDLHGHLSEQMVEGVCGSDRQSWEVAAVQSKAALEQRIDLWTSVLNRHQELSVAG